MGPSNSNPSTNQNSSVTINGDHAKTISHITSGSNHSGQGSSAKGPTVGVKGGVTLTPPIPELM